MKIATDVMGGSRRNNYVSYKTDQWDRAGGPGTGVYHSRRMVAFECITASVIDWIDGALPGIWVS